MPAQDLWIKLVSLAREGKEPTSLDPSLRAVDSCRHFWEGESVFSKTAALSRWPCFSGLPGTPDHRGWHKLDSMGFLKPSSAHTKLVDWEDKEVGVALGGGGGEYGRHALNGILKQLAKKL